MDQTIMSRDKIIEELNEVLQIDIDAIGAYTDAINACDEVEIKNQLRVFQGDHERHVRELEALVRREGGEPRRRPDLKGFLQRGMTKIAGMIGTESTLRAMLANERTTNEVYAKHVGKAFPADILEVLRRNYGDEQRHFAWIEAAVQQRLWERSAPQPSV